MSAHNQVTKTIYIKYFSRKSASSLMEIIGYDQYLVYSLFLQKLCCKNVSIHFWSLVYIGVAELCVQAADILVYNSHSVALLCFSVWLLYSITISMDNKNAAQIEAQITNQI